MARPPAREGPCLPAPALVGPAPADPTAGTSASADESVPAPAETGDGPQPPEGGAGVGHLPRRLHGELLRGIAAGGSLRRFPAHTVLVHEGDTADTLFVLLCGRVKVYATNAHGREVVLRTLGPGEYFGEMAVDGGRRSASVMTVEPCTCSVVSAARLRECIARYPDFALTLIHDLIDRVRSLTESVKSLALDDVHGRVAALLRELAEKTEGERGRVREPLTQRDIAGRVGASREMTGRVLRQLQAGGYVELRRGRIALLKPLPDR